MAAALRLSPLPQRRLSPLPSPAAAALPRRPAARAAGLPSCPAPSGGSPLPSRPRELPPAQDKFSNSVTSSLSSTAITGEMSKMAAQAVGTSVPKFQSGFSDVRTDLSVRVSFQECFYEKDFLNHRYHAKRCLYLCVIAKSLSSSPLVQDEARKPVLHVYSATEIAELPGFYVRIIPTASSLFNVSKMNLSTRNNVRIYRRWHKTTHTKVQ